LTLLVSKKRLPRSPALCLVGGDAGIVIGTTNLPLVNEGEALFHVAKVNQPASAELHIERFQNRLDPSLDDGNNSEPALN
ncbi:MAG TPA: hypothetical protein DEP13_05615, partial [Gammaproteobacteria bacterium]|nr:hypothetical protein [Gammaproteobacteria bacterium]